MILVYIAAGSALGGVARYLLGGVVQRWAGPGFPLGTLAVNASGALALGFLMRYLLDASAVTPEFRAFLTIGLCGGYTTFSTFSYETVALLESGSYGRAGLYMLASVALSVGASLLGLVLARELAVARSNF